MRFDIHLASDKMSAPLAQKFLDMGFRKDEFVAGTPGVIHKHHLSLHPATKGEFQQAWAETVACLTEASEDDFWGYAEAETIAPQFRAEIDFKPFDPAVPPPFDRIILEECPEDLHKTFDFHVVADQATLDGRLHQTLVEALGLYHVDIRKGTGRSVRVYTFQPMGLKISPRPYFDALLKYLYTAGGMEGKLKMEATYAYARFPRRAHVPPVTTRMPQFSPVL